MFCLYKNLGGELLLYLLNAKLFIIAMMVVRQNLHLHIHMQTAVAAY